MIEGGREALLARLKVLETSDEALHGKQARHAHDSTCPIALVPHVLADL